MSNDRSSPGPAKASGPARRPKPALQLKNRQLKNRRLTFSHINIVDQPMLRKALRGTIVGNTMEWYDIGIFG